MSGRAVINRTDQKFGKLTVVALAPERRRRKVLWICRCECGNEHRVDSDHWGEDTKLQQVPFQKGQATYSRAPETAIRLQSCDRRVFLESTHQTPPPWRPRRGHRQFIWLLEDHCRRQKIQGS